MVTPTLKNRPLELEIQKMKTNWSADLADGVAAIFESRTVPATNQITVVAFQSVQLAQASFLQKNQTLQNVFLISITLR